MNLLRRPATSVLVALMLVSLALSSAHAAPLTYELVPVGNPGNANDLATGGIYGGVAYDYQIGKYEVTISQYAAFLNAVAKDDVNQLYLPLYSSQMGSDLNVAGISQTGSAGSYSYTVVGPSGATPSGASSAGNRPIAHVNFLNAVRFANWMANGQPTGGQNSTTTEDGAYNVPNWIYGIQMNSTNPNTGAAPTYYIPLENEWYKAAYFSPVLNSGSGGYYKYATQSNTAPGNSLGGVANQANAMRMSDYALCINHDQFPLSNQNYLTEAGAFSGSGSYYGTYDQAGNVAEWNMLSGTVNTRGGLRGSAWGDVVSHAEAGYRYDTASMTSNYNGVGFRLAAPVAVPEPSTYAMALAGLACGGYSMFRRRKQA